MHYRDDQAALETRRDDLRQEIADLRRKAEELHTAVREQEAAERELLALEARLAHLSARRSSLLENVRVASPCTASWEAMTGDERVRFCGECKKNVYNLSAMAREEAERLLAEREGSICVRLYRRADGTVITADCPVGARKKRVRLSVIAVAGAGALAAAATAYTRTHVSCSSREAELVGQAHLMGAVAAPEQYVAMELPGQREMDLVLVYWRRSPAAEQDIERWKVYAGGRVVHEIEGGPGTRIVSTGTANPAALNALLVLAKGVAPYASGITYGPTDTVPHAGFALYGNGKHQGTSFDSEALMNVVRQLGWR